MSTWASIFLATSSRVLKKFLDAPPLLNVVLLQSATLILWNKTNNIVWG